MHQQSILLEIFISGYWIFLSSSNLPINDKYVSEQGQMK